MMQYSFLCDYNAITARPRKQDNQNYSQIETNNSDYWYV